MSRSSSMSSKLECLVNGKHREMHVNLCSIDGFTSKILVHLLWVDSLVIDLRSVIDVKTMSFSCNCFEKGWTATRVIMRSCMTVIVYRRWKSHLPGGPSTINISPLFTTPSMFWRMSIFRDPFPEPRSFLAKPKAWRPAFPFNYQ